MYYGEYVRRLESSLSEPTERHMSAESLLVMLPLQTNLSIRSSVFYKGKLAELLIEVHVIYVTSH